MTLGLKHKKIIELIVRFSNPAAIELLIKDFRQTFIMKLPGQDDRQLLEEICTELEIAEAMMKMEEHQKQSRAFENVISKLRSTSLTQSITHQ